MLRPIFLRVASRLLLLLVLDPAADPAGAETRFFEIRAPDGSRLDGLVPGLSADGRAVLVIGPDEPGIPNVDWFGFVWTRTLGTVGLRDATRPSSRFVPLAVSIQPLSVVGFLNPTDPEELLV